MWVDFNINDYVKVKLTDKGRRILSNYYNGSIPDWFTRDYVNKDGWARFPSHELATIFGPYLYNGNPNIPFEMGIKVEINDIPGDGKVEDYGYWWPRGVNPVNIDVSLLITDVNGKEWMFIEAIHRGEKPLLIGEVRRQTGMCLVDTSEFVNVNFFNDPIPKED
jgi:hypothetical protein